LELRQILFLVRIRDGFVGLERCDFLCDLITRLSELLALRVDAEPNRRNIYPHVVIFGDVNKAVLLGNGRGLRLQLWIRFVWTRALVEPRHVLLGGDGTLNMLLGELDLLRLLRSRLAGIEQNESQKC